MISMSTLALAVPPVPHGHNAYCLPGNKVTGLEQDGPAMPLQQCFFTDASATPAPGNKINVKAGDSLLDAWKSAKCGDTLLLDPEGVWGTKGQEGDLSLRFEGKNCKDDEWIWIRTAAPGLPPIPLAAYI